MRARPVGGAVSRTGSHAWRPIRRRTATASAPRPLVAPFRPHSLRCARCVPDATSLNTSMSVTSHEWLSVLVALVLFFYSCHYPQHHRHRRHHFNRPLHQLALPPIGRPPSLDRDVQEVQRPDGDSRGPPEQRRRRRWLASVHDARRLCPVRPSGENAMRRGGGSGDFGWGWRPPEQRRRRRWLASKNGALCRV